MCIRDRPRVVRGDGHDVSSEMDDGSFRDSSCFYQFICDHGGRSRCKRGVFGDGMMSLKYRGGVRLPCIERICMCACGCVG